MSDITERFVEEEAERQKRIVAEAQKVVQQNETSTPKEGIIDQLLKWGQEQGFGQPGQPITSDDLKKLIQTGIAIVNAAGGQSGISEPEKGLAAAEKEFSSQATQGELFKLAQEARDRAMRVAQRALKASGIKETETKLKQLEKTWRITGNIYNAQINALLMNPRISFQKLLTDTINLPVQAVFKGIGVASQHGLAAGAKTTFAALHGFKESYKDAMKLAFMTFKSGEPEFIKSLGIEDPKSASYALEAWDTSAHAASFRFFKAINSVYSSGSRLIISSDQFAKALAYRGELHMNGFIDGLKKAEDLDLVGAAKMHYAELWSEHLVNDAPNWLHQKALEGMFKDTFTDTGKIVRAVEQLRGSVPGLKFVVPIFRTPFNLIKQGIAITPFAPLVAGKEMLSGGLDSSVAVAKWMVGTAMYYEIIDQVNRGNITGDGPPGAGKKLWPGYKHPRSIRIGGHWVSYAHLGPFAESISLAADSAEMYNASKNPDHLGRLIGVTGDVLKEQLEHLPFIEEMFNFHHALESWKTGGSGKAAKEFAARTGTGFIPAAVREGAQINDPRVKDAHTVKEMFQEDIPGWSNRVPPKTDEYGYNTYPPGAYDDSGRMSKMHYLANQLNPLPVYPDLEVDELDKEKYRVGYVPKPVPNVVWGEGPDAVPITESQQYEWEQQTGHELKAESGMDLHTRGMWLIKQPFYKKMSPDMQKGELHALYTRYLDAGRQYLMNKYPNLQQKALQYQVNKAGLSSGVPFEVPGVTTTPETAGTTVMPKISAP